MEQQQQEEEERQSPPPQPPPPAPDKTAAGADESERSRLMSEALQREDEFLEYIMSLSGGDAGSAQDSGVAEEDDGAAAPASAAPDGAPPGTAGLDHLDNLCKLMEQLGDLKEQNTKLQRRVQYLEDAKRLRAVPRDSPPAPPPPPPPPPPGPVVIPRGRSRSVGLQKSKAKVSKWTKVKEAFRWERAALAADHHKAAAHAAASSSSSSSDDLDLSMHFADIFPDAGGPGSSGGGSVSAAESRRLSFPEEEHDEDARRSRSLDADAITCQLSGKDISPLSKSPSGKAHRTPWGKVKDIIIQTRKDSLKRRGAGSTDAHLDATGDGDAPQEADAAKAPRLTLTTASSEELRWPDPQRPPPKPSPSPVTDPEEERRPSHQGSPPPARRHSSKWTKVKKAFLTARPGSPPYSPRDHETFGYAAQAGESDEAPAESLHAEVQRSYEELQHKLSLEFQEKLAEWERARLAVAAAADLGAEEPAHDRGARRHHQHHQQQYPLSADFRKKLSEWQRRKDDGSPRAARKPAKELLWLEKELHKIAREKARLERERDKFLQREARLEKMRKAMCAGQEVLVQTSTGSFRFQGISEAFTRRLFEWEQARGIGPEDSTFALLDPRFRPLARQSAGHDSGPPGAESALLSRCKSAGSVAPGAGVAALTRQASSLSLNDAQLEAATAAAAATPQLEDGRAVSEPRLRTGGLEDADADDGPAALIVDVEDEVVETAGPLATAPAVRGRTPVYCYAPREVARLIDSSGRLAVLNISQVEP